MKRLFLLGLVVMLVFGGVLPALGAKWTQLPSLSMARGFVIGAVCNDYLYAFGGDDWDGSALLPQIICERLDLTNSIAWDDAGVTDFPDAVGCDESIGIGFDTGSTFLGLADKIVVPGIGQWSSCISDVYIYDTTGNSWTQDSNLNLARRNHAVEFVPSTKAGVPGMWVFGGYDDTGVATETIEYCDSSSKGLVWTNDGTLPTAPDGICRFDACYYPGTGLVYILGGRMEDNSTTGYVYSFNPTTQTWSSAITEMLIPVSNYQIALLQDGDGVWGMYIFGGRDTDGYPIATVQRFLPDTGVAEQLSAENDLPMLYIGSAVQVYDNKAYVYGGFDGSTAVTDQCWVFDPTIHDPVTIYDFTATPGTDSVTLTWRAQESVDHYGYNLYRTTQSEAIKSSTSKSFVKLNDSLIVGSTPYSFVDSKVEKGKTYIYRLEAVKIGTDQIAAAAEDTCTVSAYSFAMAQCFPNPADAYTNINFTISESMAPAQVTLSVYDLSGRLVTTVAGAENYTPGLHNLKLDTTSLASGVYSLKLTANSESATGTMVVTH